jgi:hypothetical protein
LGVIEKKRHSFEGRGRVAGFELFQVGAAHSISF